MKNHGNTTPQKVGVLEAFTHLCVSLSRVDILWTHIPTGFAILSYILSIGQHKAVLETFTFPLAAFVLRGGFRRGLF